MRDEVAAKLLLGLDTQTRKTVNLGPEMDWEEFREQYRTTHLRTVRDRTASDAESRLDIAERIICPKTLGQMAETTTLTRLQTALLSGVESRRAMPRSPHTVRGYMKSILAALNWAYLQDWLSTEPKLPKLKTPKLKAMKGRPISEDEFERMIDATEEVVGKPAKESWQHILRGLWTSGLRIGELMHLSWDLPGTISPRWNAGQHPTLFFPADRQKNDTSEEIPLLPDFEQLLLETPAVERTGWVFRPLSLQLRLGRKVRHHRPDAEWVSKVVSRIGAEASIVVTDENLTTGHPRKYASAHDLRRSCAERLRNAGVPPQVVSKVLRHASWETTQKHYAPGDIQAAAAILRQSEGSLSTGLHR